MWSARQWKAFYAQEREMLGPGGISRLLDEAEPLVPDAGALVFPHTRLSTSGALAAAAALAVLRSGADEVLVRRARQGEPAALVLLRRVHGPGVSRPVLLGMRLVNYADVLGVPEPTWVAAALVGFGAAAGHVRPGQSP